MDWRVVGFDWNQLRAFLVTAEEGSFSAAARALGASQPTIGRHVAAFEEELGVTLFERVGTRLDLTPTGVELLEHAHTMAGAALRVSRVAAGKSATVEGEVVITASEVIARFLLPPVLGGLRRDHPGIELEVVATNEKRDLHQREADIAIRNMRPSRPDLVAQRLRDLRVGFYASPEYLERVGPLDTPEDVGRRATVLAFDQRDRVLHALQAVGIAVTAKSLPVMSKNHLVLWALCRHGLGLAMIVTEVGEAEPDVVRVLPDFAFPMESWLVCHRELRTSRRLRIVFDHLVAALGSGPRVR
ncbi:MAG: LysR family transcriptional regulator [Myxococcota bacterium]